jgi:hypothetical protein
MERNNLFSGEYVFYENGVEVHREKNLITKFGKRFLTGYLAGQNSFAQKDIAVGIGTTAASVDDNQLEFEFYRSSVFLSSTDIQTDSLTGESTYAVIYKTTLPTDVDGVITEVGLFPSATFGNTDFSSRFITSFENPNSWSDSNGDQPETVSTPDPRIGQSLFKISALSGAEKEYWFTTSFDISGYSNNDSLSLAFRQADANLDYAFIRFYSSDTSYYEIQFPGSTAGNKLIELTMDNLFNNSIGTPDSGNIVKISAGVKAKSSGASTVYFDGLRINDEDSYNPQYGLISRSVLGTPIDKVLGRQMDIEYRLGLSL